MAEQKTLALPKENRTKSKLRAEESWGFQRIKQR